MAQRREDSRRTHNQGSPAGGGGRGQETHSPTASATRNAQDCLRIRPRTPVYAMPGGHPMRRRAMGRPPTRGD
eukprot:3788292-Pyramimonas_sp.AAC.1